MGEMGEMGELVERSLSQRRENLNDSPDVEPA
jgi:hypothetical protein